MFNFDVVEFLNNLVNYFIELGAQPFYIVLWEVLKNGGWVFFLLMSLWVVKEVWISNRIGKYVSSQTFILLAIDVPKQNEQTPKAVENIFSHLAGAHSSIDFVDFFFKGKIQNIFSLEIISLEGYIQFLIRLNRKHRDLVEASIYAQYPDAEITEVADYAKNVPSVYPDEEYDLWGTEFILCENEAYPIRTYQQFEHALTGEFKDPLAAFLENLSRIGRGEQVWFQLLIRPIEQKTWRKNGLALVDELLGKKAKYEDTFLMKLLFLPIEIFKMFFSQIMGTAEDTFEEEKKTKRMEELTPGEKKVIEAVQYKLAKIGYEAKIRVIYVGKKQVFDKERGAYSLIGAIKQFNTLDCNSFKPELKKVGTAAKYVFVKQRVEAKQTAILDAYKKRSFIAGAPYYVLNIEELATIYHFPSIDIKAPLIKKTEAKKAEPPSGLPV